MQGNKKLKKIISTVLGVVLIVGAFFSIGAIKNAKDHLAQDKSDIELETVNDVPTSDGGPKSTFTVKAKGAVLVDAETGEVLFQQDAHKELPLASVTKVMTMLLVMDAVDQNKITLDDEVTISERAASMGGSQMYMEFGEKHKVSELLKGVAMASANDGCVALAEYIAGSEEIFVERMNERARELGMKDTHFVNTNGLPVTDHYSSAYDISVMSRELYKHEKIREYFTTWQDNIIVGLPGKEKEFGLTNTNKLIKQYQGCNGIKTGFTNDAGFCLSASATRNDTHLIAVALGCTTSKERNAEVSKLLDYGFANFETKVVCEKDQTLGKIEVSRGEPNTVEVVSERKLTALVPKGEKDKVTSKVVLDEKVNLPLKAGDKVGTLYVYKDGKRKDSCMVVSKYDVDKASFKTLIKRAVTYKRKQTSK